uniref:Methyltransferase domain-containing protein n=1 Tax=Coccolithus braarudii TaxID=221442 RepID=A0A6T7K7A5_9EUKA
MLSHKHAACEGARTLFTATRLAQIEDRVLEWEQSSLARLSDAITARGLAMRSTHPADRKWKSSLLSLTDEGCGSRENLTSPVHYKLRPNYELWRSAVTASCESSKGQAIPELTWKARKKEGRADGERETCGWRAFAGDPKCVVYSLGSAGNYLFEKTLIRSTGCTVHTFDCTLDSAHCETPAKKQCASRYNSTHLISARHWFHPFCIASTDGVPDARYKTLATVNRELGHGSMRLSLLKMDIEGFEWPILRSWRMSDVGLPEQFSAEFHCTTSKKPRHNLRQLSLGEATAVLSHFHRLGYRLSHLAWEGGGVDASFVRTRCPT